MGKFELGTEDQVRAWLAGKLRRTDVPDEVWKHDEVQECVAAYLGGREPRANVESAARRKIREGRRVTRSMAQLRPRLAPTPAQSPGVSVALREAEQARADAAAFILARQVALGDGSMPDKVPEGCVLVEDDPQDDVPTFRAEVLGDRFPLSLAEADSFVVDEPRPTTGKLAHFFYAGKFRAVAPDSPVARLWRLGDRLAQLHGWDASATMRFVLSGETPPLSPISVRVDQRPASPASTTITITAEWWLSEDTVLRAFRAARRHATRTLTYGEESARPADVNARNWRIYRFVLEHTDAEWRRQGTWEELRRKWNAQCPQGEQSPSFRRFRGDFERADAAQFGPLHKGNPESDM